MPNNSMKMIFMLTLISGIMMVMSSNSWFGAWMGLEINLLSFIPLMINSNNIYTTEATMKYFLIQALASSLLLFIILLNYSFESPLNQLIEMKILITMPLFLKSGVAPFHWWFPSVMEGLDWLNCLILMTLQKFAPLSLLFMLLENTNQLTFTIIASVIIGSIGGMNQLSLRKLLTYSSINHIGWSVAALMVSKNMWLFYMVTYSLMTMTIILIIKPMNLSFVNQIYFIGNSWTIKFLLLSSFLSLGGLPPFFGFLPKWLVIQYMINNNMILIISIMIMFSLITLFYYLRIFYSTSMLLHHECSWNINKFTLPPNKLSTLLFSMLTGMLYSPMLIFIF
uniref:NADH dehydrogenase subunit 2 n=1 Tax=Margattea limbata TaxID=3037043 RepID=UPI00279FC218|nr:NADH dehydrogenase subunit 2 [Margattea limbata]WGO57756.1 NADH dehydrogenase subunit 2 [Margattea limbata]